MEPPSGNFLDVGAEDGLLDSDDAVYSGLGEPAFHITIVSFEFSEGIEKSRFQVVIGQNSCGLADDPVLVL